MVEEAAAAASPRSTGIVGGGRLVGDGARVSGSARASFFFFFELGSARTLCYSNRGITNCQKKYQGNYSEAQYSQLG